MSVANPLRPFVSWRFILNERSELIPNNTAIPIHEGLHRLAIIFRSFRAWKVQEQNPRNPPILLIYVPPFDERSKSFVFLCALLSDHCG
jgi:hypothetical protein